MKISRSFIAVTVGVLIYAAIVACVGLLAYRSICIKAQVPKPSCAHIDFAWRPTSKP